MTPTGLVVASDQQGYAREKKNVYWCKLHQQAFNAVTDEWQSYYDLKEKTGLAYNIFEDLWAFGEVDRGYVPTTNGLGAQNGFIGYFKRAVDVSDHVLLEALKSVQA